jgi:micrococcal nuclease
VRRILFATIAVFLTAPNAWAFDAIVTRCHDGDTCTVVPPSEHHITIRLHAINAPEIGRAYGDEARDIVMRLILGHHVDVRPISGFSYGRTAADPVVEDGPGAGVDAGAYMAAVGAAWVEDRWNLNPDAPTLQANTLIEHRGLWADPSAVPPWAWRHEPPWTAPPPGGQE